MNLERIDRRNVYLDRSAEISPCNTYRYVLRRRWAEAGTRVLWVMLNPSVASDTIDDPTIRKCVGFSRRWGHAELAVVNLYAFRATDPRVLKNAIGGSAPHAIGPSNDEIIAREVGNCDQIILAWGNHAPPQRAAEVFHLINMHVLVGRSGLPRCLGRTGANQPRHPLMAPYATRVERF